MRSTRSRQTQARPSDPFAAWAPPLPAVCEGASAQGARASARRDVLLSPRGSWPSLVASLERRGLGLAVCLAALAACSQPPAENAPSPEDIVSGDVPALQEPLIPRYDPATPRTAAMQAAQRGKLDAGEDFNALTLLPGVSVASQRVADEVVVSSTGLRVPLAGNEALLELEPGAVLAGGRSGAPAGRAGGAKNPFGFVRKVKTVTIDGDAIHIETERAKFAEIFAGAVHVTMDPADAEPIDVSGVDLREYFPNLEDYTPPGDTTARGAFEQARGAWGLDLDVKKDWGFDARTWRVPPVVASYTFQKWNATHTNVLWSVPVSLTANIDFTAAVKLGVQLQMGFDVDTPADFWNSSLNYAKVVAGGSLDVDTTTDFTLTLGVGASATTLTGEMKGAMMDELKVTNPIPPGPLEATTIATLGPFTGPTLGPVPTSFLIEFKAACEIGGSATLHAKAFAKLNTLISLGFVYTKRDGIRFPFESTFDQQVSFQFLDGGAAVNVTCEVGPRLSWLVGDIGGPYIDGRAIADASLSYHVGCEPPATKSESGPRTGTLSASFDAGFGIYLGGMIMLEAADMTVWEYDFGAMELYKKLWSVLDRSWEIDEGGSCPSDCENKKPDNFETGVDCGGDTCGPCAEGGACDLKLDCGKGLLCKAGKCLPEDPEHPGDPNSVMDTCRNGIRDYDEWDVDCGLLCGQCKLGQKCTSLEQCASGACTSGVCVGWDCNNNHWESCCETAVDCGGNCKVSGAEKRCGIGQRCVWDDDCASNACRPLKIVGTADPVSVCVPVECDPYNPKNPMLCGGQCTYEYWQGKLLAGLDYCKNGLCGYEFGKCKAKQPCQVDRDCLSGYCDPGIKTCQTPLCQNKVRDDGEMGVDCGGSCIPFCEDKFGVPISWAGVEEQYCYNHTCPVETLCKKNSDCTYLPGPTWQSSPYLTTCSDWTGTAFVAPKRCRFLQANGVLDSGVWDTTSWDTIKDGPVYSESDIDCGGTSGKPCKALDHCQGDADCEAGLACRREIWGNWRCLAAEEACDDGDRALDETDVDCGGRCGGYPMGCKVGQGCTKDGDCWSGKCDAAAPISCEETIHGYECSGVVGACRDMCDNGVKNAAEGEADIDCAGPFCAARCPNDKTCKTHDDCDSRACNPKLGLCKTSTCDDGFAGGTEPDADCGRECNAMGWPLGKQCPGGKRCKEDSDCWSGTCDGSLNGGTCAFGLWENGVLDGGWGGAEADVDCGANAPSVCPYGKPCDLRCEDGKSCGSDAQCRSGMCLWEVAPAVCGFDACRDHVKDEGETGADCGGPCKTKCPNLTACNHNGDCQSKWCHDKVCYASSCDDGSLTYVEGETDRDCGGGGACVGMGRRCALGKHCKTGDDCLSGFCDAANTCVASACEDKRRSASETDVDCGGSCATKCALSRGCKSDGDCGSGFCNGALCVASGCSDLKKSAGETDVDCGGVCTATCSTGKTCALASDCTSKLCSAGKVCVTSSCDDGKHDGDETDLDCGGSCKTDCLDGAKCKSAGDCASGICGALKVCLSTCFNLQKNLDESDVDCGGKCGATCATGAACHLPADCASGACSSDGRCLSSTCTDGKLSGDETDLDCGGACPGKCGIGESCATGGDCASTWCDAGKRCVASHCDDGAQSGGETGVDCGSGCPTGCPIGAACSADPDCLSGACALPSSLCVGSTCENQRKDPNEADLDCGGACAARCALGGMCGKTTDCGSLICSTAGVCVGSTCEDGLESGDETAVDCGGSCGARCGYGLACLVGSDCGTGLCSSVGMCACLDGTVWQAVAAACVDCACVVANSAGASCDTAGQCTCRPGFSGKPCDVKSDVCAADALVCDDASACTADSCHPILGCLNDAALADGEACDDLDPCTAASTCAAGSCLAGALAPCPDDGDLCTIEACDKADGACKTRVTSCDDLNLCTDDSCAPASGCQHVDNTLACGPGSVCTGGVCEKLACENGTLDGAETDVDCGGSCAKRCPAGKGCALDADCVSAFCSALKVCVASHCDDGKRSGDESDLDCGGSCSARCGTGSHCAVDADCATSLCNAATGCVTSHCADGKRSGDETDVDCGGSCVVDCAVGAMCGVGIDCVSGVCAATSLLCVVSTCFDQKRDGEESDVDCGGTCAATCALGGVCAKAEDCDSGVCSVSLRCAESTCEDGRKSGPESDVDCGGTCPAACPLGASCAEAADCGSGVCSVASVCAASTCVDGRQNDTETDVDCGGTCAVKCPLGNGCAAAADCGSGVCSVGLTCVASSCEDGRKGGGEADVDCGGVCATPCAVGAACLVPGDCASGACSVAGSCVASMCEDGKKDGGEADVDCGGSCVATCGFGLGCTLATDCVTAFCSVDGKCACADTMFWNVSAAACEDCGCAVATSNGAQCDSTGQCDCKPGWGEVRCDLMVNVCLADALTCDDLDACSIDTCDAVVGCVYDAVAANDLPCDAGDPCKVGTACQLGQCVGGTPVTCIDDGDLCTTEACDAADGQCKTTTNTCDDANTCTDDSCDAATGCAHVNNVVACEYGCTNGTSCIVGKCKAGQCVGGCSVLGLPGQPVRNLGTLSPNAIAMSDFNGDGRLDLALHGSNGQLGIALGNGDGTYGDVVSYPSHASWYGNAGVAAGDLNGDGFSDVVWTNIENDSVSVLLGNGDGTFLPKPEWNSIADYATSPGQGSGWRPFAVAIGDVNKDGKPDLVVANGTDGGYVSILLGDGAGYFALSNYLNYGGVLTSLTLGKVNADNTPDLAFTRGQGYLGSVSVALADGYGGFSYSPSDYTLGAQQNSSTVEIGDLNGDGKGDLAVSNVIDKSVAVLMGNGSGTFTAPVYYTVPGFAHKVAMADLDGSGKLDLVARSFTISGCYLSLLLNNGNGTFKPRVDKVASCSEYRALAAGDVDGDLKLDLVLPNMMSDGLTFLLNNGDGTFNVRQDYAAGAGPSSVRAADLDANGTLDLVVTNKTANTVSVLLGSGAGTFAAQVSYATGTGPESVAVGDLSGDSKPDIAVANFDGDTVSVLVNNGNGTFKAKVDYASGDGPISIAVSDLTGDGKPDVAVVNNLGLTVSVLANKGGGAFQPKVDYAAGWAPTAVVAGDFNADERPDLAITNDAGMSVLLNTGSGTLAFKVDYATSTVPTSLGIGDLDGDTRPDIAVAVPLSFDTAVAVFRGRADGTFEAQAASGAGVRGDTLSIADFNTDKRVDVVMTTGTSAAVNFLAGRGDGTFVTAARYDTSGGKRSVVAGDFNGDGKPDLAVANSTTASVSVLLNTCLDKP